MGWIDRDGAADWVISQLGAKRSAWNAADIRGKVEVLLAQTNLVAEPCGAHRARRGRHRPRRRTLRSAARLTRRARTRPLADLPARGEGGGGPRPPPRPPRREARQAGSAARARIGAGRPHPGLRRRRPGGRRPAGGRGGRGRGRQDHRAEGGAGSAGTAGTSAAGGDADVEGGRGRCRGDRRRRALGRLADPPARLALGRRRALGAAPRRHTGPSRTAATRGPVARRRGGDAGPGHRPRAPDDRRRGRGAGRAGRRPAPAARGRPRWRPGPRPRLGPPDRGRVAGEGAPVHRPRLRRTLPAHAHRRRPGRGLRRAPPRADRS